MRLAVIGAGWAGLSCAVRAAQAGHRVTLFEASRTPGGRARRLDDARGLFDNGQHILIGAYSATLALMREVGVAPTDALLRLPLTLRFPDNTGLALPRWPAPFDLAGGILQTRGWSWSDKLSLLRTALGWRRQGFACAASTTVATLCRPLSPRVMHELIEPLCVAALNTPVAQSSGTVFLRVLRDALFGERGGADLLLPRLDLTALLPDAALRWLTQRGADLRMGTRVQAIAALANGQWRIAHEDFDAIVLACAPWDAQRLVRGACVGADAWVDDAQALRHEAIATVYVQSPWRLATPMVALRSGSEAPAQFVFDRGQLGGPPGLLAFVVSANTTPRDQLAEQVLAQAQTQLGPHCRRDARLRVLQTVVEKRATFACTPGLRRPSARIAPGLAACGDYIDGPYPATLEGAVRSGAGALAALQPAA